MVMMISWREKGLRTLNIDIEVRYLLDSFIEATYAKPINTGI